MQRKHGEHGENNGVKLHHQGSLSPVNFFVFPVVKK